MHWEQNQQLLQDSVEAGIEGCVLMCRAHLALRVLSGIPGCTADKLTLYTSALAWARDLGRSIKQAVTHIKINKIAWSTCARHTIFTQLLQVSSPALLFWYKYFRSVSRQGVVTSTKALRSLLKAFLILPGRRAGGLKQHGLTSAHNTVPPHCYFHCHEKVLLKGVPQADCLQSLLQDWCSLQSIWHSRSSREVSADKIADFTDHTFQCYSAFLTTVSDVAAPASCAVFWITARLDVLFWRSL